MAITKLNSLAIPAGTVEPADISYPLTNFSSTGIDDNATSTALTIDSTGNVGIGITSPSTVLDIEGAWVNNQGLLALNATSGVYSGLTMQHSGTAKGYLYYDNASQFLDLYSTNALRLIGGGSESMRITSSGSVGIGETNPQEKLHVYTTADSRVEVESTTGLAAFKATNNQGSYAWYVDSSADKFHLYDFTDASNRLTLDGAGNVGIGTTAPNVNLHVKTSDANARIGVWNSGAANSSRYAQILLTQGSTFFGASDKSWQLVSLGQSDGTTKFQIQNWNGSAYKLALETTETGYVTKPQTPAFSYGAYTTYDVPGTGTQIASTSTVWNNSSYVHLNYNNGSHFNPSNGRFTAPVAGIYRFDYRCGVADHSSGYFWWYIYKNSTAIAYWQSTQGMSSGSDDVALASLHVYVNLAANDYIEVKWANNYVSGTVYYPHFSGALVA